MWALLPQRGAAVLLLSDICNMTELQRESGSSEYYKNYPYYPASHVIIQVEKHTQTFIVKFIWNHTCTGKTYLSENIKVLTVFERHSTLEFFLNFPLEHKQRHSLFWEKHIWLSYHNLWTWEIWQMYILLTCFYLLQFKAS